jgi:hypothetical protein
MRYLLVFIFLLPLSNVFAQEKPDIICHVDISKKQTGEELYTQSFDVLRGQFWVRYKDALIDLPGLGEVRIALAADGGDGKGNYFFAQMFVYRTSDNLQISKLYLKKLGKSLSQNFFEDYHSTIRCKFGA